MAALCLLAGCAACSRADASLERQLDAAEALLWSGDSAEVALARLTAIDTAAVAEGEQRARLALLTAYARHKSYIDDTTLTVLAPALARYDGPSPRGSRRNRALALFLKGRISYNREAYADAIIDLMKADDLLEGTDHHLLRGFIRQSIAESYQDIFSLKEQLHYNQLALESFEASGRQDYTAYALVDVAQGYQHIQEFEEAITIAIKASQFADSINDIRLKAKSNIIEARALLLTDREQEAIELYEKCLENRPSVFTYNDAIVILSKAANKNIKLPNALKEFLDKLYKQEHSSGNPQQFAAQGMFKEAYEAQKQMSDMAWIKLGRISSKNVAGALLRAKETDKALLNNKIRSRNIIILLIALLSAAVMIILRLLYKAKIRESERIKSMLYEQNRGLDADNKRLQSDLSNTSSALNIAENELNSTKSQLKDANQDIKHLKGEITALEEKYNSDLTLLKKLNQDRNEGSLNSCTQDYAILNNIFSNWHDLLRVSADDSLKGKLHPLASLILRKDILDDLLNQKLSVCPELSDYIKSAESCLNEDDYKIFLLLLCGIVPKGISLIMGVKTDSVYRKKYNIKKMLGHLPTLVILLG